MDNAGFCRLVLCDEGHHTSRMRINQSRIPHLDDKYHFPKPQRIVGEAQRSPEVVARVSEMLLRIEREGRDAVLSYARELDGWTRNDFELSAAEVADITAAVPPHLREMLELGRDHTRAFAKLQREHLTDFSAEIAPGLEVGQRYVPVGRVGAYLPAGRFPILASAFMTVNVAKVAGVPSVLVCTPPQRDGRPDPAVLYSALLSGADRYFVLGGVQALAAMAFGLLGEQPIDMLVGAGNAYVAEAKRQLFGTVSIDLLAGPSEVLVLADDSADPELVAADLLGQAEHGTNSPAGLVTTSDAFAAEVIREVDAQLAELATEPIAGPAWRDYGLVVVADDDDVAVELVDELAAEHLEIQTRRDDWFYERLHNYGSVFLGPWSTVAYSDKGMAGTNHVLPTAGGAKHSAGLSVSRFLKPLTFQRLSKDGTEPIARAVEIISNYEGMAAHGATASLRLKRL